MIISVMVCCGFIVCWTPNEVLVFIDFFTHSVDVGSWFYQLTLVIMFYQLTVVMLEINSCINPLIYAAKYREFQHGIRRLTSKSETDSTPV